MCLSSPVFEEYVAVLGRARFEKYPNFKVASLGLLQEINNLSLWFEPKLTIDVLDDKDDNKFLELAVEAHAGYIVTGNSKDFIIKSYDNIPICSPKEFYEIKTTMA